MACSSCQKNKQIKKVQRLRINSNQQNSNQEMIENKVQEIASSKFQSPKVLSPLK